MPESQLTNQPNARPTPKLVAAGATGSATLVLVWAADQAGLDMPEPVAAAIVLLAALIAGYFKRNRRPKGDTPGTNGIPDHAAS